MYIYLQTPIWRSRRQRSCDLRQLGSRAQLGSRGALRVADDVSSNMAWEDQGEESRCSWENRGESTINRGFRGK